MGAGGLMAVPPPPPGFVLDPQPTAPPPPGYRLDPPAARREAQPSSVASALVASGQVHDGDTFRLSNGPNARLFGIDAFELPQQSRSVADALIPAGENARKALLPYVAPGSSVSSTAASTYGRPVVTLGGSRGDAGLGLIERGWAVPELTYLSTDPKRRDEYIAAQRTAIADEQGAYAGTYQLPRDFRRQGDAAPWRGKIPMTPQQAGEYNALTRDPKTTPEKLQAWGAAQGQAITNAGNILSFMRRNPTAKASPYFQQRDAADQAVLPNSHGIVERHAGVFNEGLAALAGFPVDIVNTGLKAVGLPMSDRPVLGSDWIKDRMHGVGAGQYEEGFAPRSDVERYSQAFFRGAGESVLPVGGTMAAGTRLALTALPTALEQGVARTAIRGAVRDAASNPRLLIAGETGANVGAEVAGQAADDYDPADPWLEAGAQIAGGLAGGLGAGAVVRHPVPARPASFSDHGVRQPSHLASPFDPSAPPRDTAPPPPPPGYVLDAARDRPEPLRPARAATTLTEAREHALDFVGQPIRNEATGVEAVVSGGGLKKMTSASAHLKSSSPDDHALAVANVDELFRRAELVELGPDQHGEQTIEAISRWHAPLETPNGVRTARMTVKETRSPKQPNPLYTVETIELEDGGARFGAGSTASAPGQNRNAAPTGSSPDIGGSAVAGNAEDPFASLPPGYVPDPPVGRLHRMDAPASAEGMASLARTVVPGDVTPLPANAVDSVDEAAAIGAGMRPELSAPDPRSTLSPYTLPGQSRPRRNPLDLVGWLRAKGGVQDYKGELRSMGVDNRPRPIDFAKDEGFLGPLVRREGMTLDDAAQAAWETGYFPGHTERPTIPEFLDALEETHRGGPARVFHPDDLNAVADYHGAAEQAQAIDAAKVAGDPLHDDRGQPIGLDDLDANSHRQRHTRIYPLSEHAPATSPSINWTARTTFAERFSR